MLMQHIILTIFQELFSSKKSEEMAFMSAKCHF